MPCANDPSKLTFPLSDLVSEGGLSVDFRPPEYVLPGSKDRLLTPLQPLRDDRKVRSAFWTCKM